jgi:membrane protein YdbS with pleckstrin-like domain
MLEIPGYITLTFILTTIATFIMFIISALFSGDKKVEKSAIIVALLTLLWLIFQSTLSLNKWYMDRTTTPPHLMFPVFSAIVMMISLFTIPRFRHWIDHVSMNVLTWIHVVRIPVEFCLFWLATQHQLPWSMTFEGYNFDIIFGITAPVVALLYFTFKKINQRVFLIWNILGLISVLAVVIRGIGAVPSPMQKWDFTQPNYAVMHFPFIWLPAVIVPIVIFTHINAIRKIILKKENIS